METSIYYYPDCPECHGTGQTPRPGYYNKTWKCSRCETRNDPRAWAKLRAKEIEKELKRDLTDIKKERGLKSVVPLYAEYNEKWINHPLVKEYRVHLQVIWIT